MADATHTARRARAHPSDIPSPVTATSFVALTMLLRAAVLRDEALDDGRDARTDADPARGADRAWAEDAVVSAWIAVEASASRFVRAHAGATGAGAILAEVAERVLALATLDGIDEKGELFDLHSDVMLLRTRMAPGASAGRLVDAILPWVAQAAFVQARLLPDPGPDDGLEVVDALEVDVPEVDEAETLGRDAALDEVPTI